MPNTEVGVSKPVPIFSACFGEAFLTLHPIQLRVGKEGEQLREMSYELIESIFCCHLLASNPPSSGMPFYWPNISLTTQSKSGWLTRAGHTEVTCMANACPCQSPAASSVPFKGGHLSRYAPNLHWPHTLRLLILRVSWFITHDRVGMQFGAPFIWRCPWTWRAFQRMCSCPVPLGASLNSTMTNSMLWSNALLPISNGTLTN
jgi:hypothetical protein